MNVNQPVEKVQFNNLTEHTRKEHSTRNGTLALYLSKMWTQHTQTHSYVNNWPILCADRLRDFIFEKTVDFYITTPYPVFNFRIFTVWMNNCAHWIFIARGHLYFGFIHVNMQSHRHSALCISNSTWIRFWMRFHIIFHALINFCWNAPAWNCGLCRNKR